MKKSLVKELIENSKFSKKASGGFGSTAYGKDHTPTNHLAGKTSRVIDGKKDLGKPRKNKKTPQITGPKAKERRSMTEGAVVDALMGMLMKFRGPKFGRELYTQLKQDEPEMYHELLDMFKDLVSRGDITDRQMMTSIMNDPNATQLAIKLRGWVDDKLPPEFDDWATKKRADLGLDDNIDEGIAGKWLVKGAKALMRGVGKAATRVEPSLSREVSPKASSMISRTTSGAMEPVNIVRGRKPVLDLPNTTPAASGMSKSGLPRLGVSPSKPSSAAPILKRPSTIESSEVDEGIVSDIAKGAWKAGSKLVKAAIKPSGSAAGDISGTMNAAALGGGAAALAVSNTKKKSKQSSGSHPAEVDEGIVGKWIVKGAEKLLKNAGTRSLIKKTLADPVRGPAYRAATGMAPAVIKKSGSGLSGALSKAAVAGTGATAAGATASAVGSNKVDEDISGFGNINELFGTDKHKDKTPVHKRKGPYMTRKEKDEWEAGDNERIKNTPKLKGPDSHDRQRHERRMTEGDKSTINKIPKNKSTKNKHLSDIKVRKLPADYIGSNKVDVIKVEESLQDLSRFLDTNINVAVNEGLFGAGLKGIKMGAKILGKEAGNIAKKVVTKAPKSTYDNVVDMAGSPVVKKLATPRLDAAKQLGKDAAALATGAGVGYGGYRAMKGNIPENSSAGAVGAGAIASTAAGGRKIQSQLFAGEMDEAGGAVPTSIRPEPRSDAMGDISREARALAPTASAVKTSIRPKPRPRVKIPSSSSAEGSDIWMNTNEDGNITSPPMGIPSSGTGNITGTTSTSPTSLSSGGFTEDGPTSSVYADFNRRIATTTGANDLNDIEVAMRRDHELSHDEMAQLQTAINIKTANAKKITEDFGSSDWTGALEQMDNNISAFGGVTPDSIEQSAQNVADDYYQDMGYDSPDEAVQRIIDMWLQRNGWGKIMGETTDPTDIVNIPQDFDSYIKQFDEYAEDKYMLSWEETGGTDHDLSKAIKNGIAPNELADKWAEHNGLSV